MYAYIDESGDTGISKKSSEYFVLSAVVFEEERRAKSIIKKIYNKFKKIRAKNLIIHTRNEKPEVKLFLQKIFKENNVKIISTVLKKKLDFDVQLQSHSLLSAKISEYGVTKVFISQRENNKLANKKLKDVFEKNNMEVIMSRPNQIFELQLSDFSAWVVYKKYNDNDETYYIGLDSEIIKPF